MVVDIVKKQIPDLDWQLVDRLEDLPEGAPALMAGEVMRGSWQIEGDDPQVRQSSLVPAGRGAPLLHRHHGAAG
jgi:hypothetical protein